MKKALALLGLLLTFAMSSHAAYYIVGNDPFGNWHPDSGMEMTPQSDGTYSCTATINGSVWFVFADGLDADWGVFNSTYRIGPLNGDETVQMNTYVTTQRAGDSGAYKFIGSGDEYTITLNPNTWKFIIEGDDILPPLEYYTVAGSSPDLFGTEWDPTNDANDTEKGSDGKYHWRKSRALLAEGTFDFKIVVNHDWGRSFPENNYVMYVPTAGYYDVEILFDPSSYEISCDIRPVGGIQPSLYGDLNGDGEVGLADVNLLIDAILSGSNDETFDVNNDKEINIADISALIDVLLGPAPSPKQLEGYIYVDANDDGLVFVRYAGSEDVTLTVLLNGIEIELNDGCFHLTDYGLNEIIVTASASGYESITSTFYVNWAKPIPPQTPSPDVIYTLTDDYVKIEVFGEGELHLYVDNEEVDIPCFVERGEYDMLVEVQATAQQEGMLMSDPTVMMIEIPAKEAGPDPHMEGYWAVFKDKYGAEVWYQLQLGVNGDFTTDASLSYEVFGDYDGNGERPDVPFYFVINGDHYGPEVDMTHPSIGFAMDNPLIEGTNRYVVSVGYNYTIGVMWDWETETWYAFIARGYPLPWQ